MITAAIENEYRDLPSPGTGGTPDKTARTGAGQETRYKYLLRSVLRWGGKRQREARDAQTHSHVSGAPGTRDCRIFPDMSWGRSSFPERPHEEPGMFLHAEPSQGKSVIRQVLENDLAFPAWA